jgi:hypothetical protein
MNGLDIWERRKCFFIAGIRKLDTLSCNPIVPFLFDGTEKIKKTLDLDVWWVADARTCHLPHE